METTMLQKTEEKSPQSTTAESKRASVALTADEIAEHRKLMAELSCETEAQVYAAYDAQRVWAERVGKHTAAVGARLRAAYDQRSERWKHSARGRQVETMCKQWSEWQDDERWEWHYWPESLTSQLKALPVTPDDINA